MDFTTNRRIAVIVLLLVMVFSTFFGVGRSLQKEASDIAGHFESGAYNEEGKYTEKSIQSHLNNRVNAANGLLTLSGQFSGVVPAAENLSEARLALIGAGTPSEKYAANEDMSVYSEQLCEVLENMALSSDQQEMLDYYISAMRGAQSAIEKLSYNKEVDEFYNRTLRSFPASLFTSFIDIEGPEYFGEKSN